MTNLLMKMMTVFYLIIRFPSIIIDDVFPIFSPPFGYNKATDDGIVCIERLHPMQTFGVPR